MGWTTGKDSAAPGKFSYELWDDARTIHSVGGYATMQEADRAGARANTNWLLYGVTEPVEATDPLAQLDADALLAELKGADNA